MTLQKINERLEECVKCIFSLNDKLMESRIKFYNKKMEYESAYNLEYLKLKSQAESEKTKVTHGFLDIMAKEKVNNKAMELIMCESNYKNIKGKIQAMRDKLGILQEQSCNIRTEEKYTSK